MPMNLLDALVRRKPEFVLLDAAQDFGVMELLNRHKGEFHNLYEGESATSLALYAPYLAKVPESTEWLEELLQKGWDRHWFIFVSSTASLEDTRAHFRKFSYVADSEGQQLYFRFYDPRVLRKFLPTCDLKQLRDFFGPISQFILQGDQPDELAVFTLGENGLQHNKGAVELAATTPC